MTLLNAIYIKFNLVELSAESKDPSQVELPFSRTAVAKKTCQIVHEMESKQVSLV